MRGSIFSICLTALISCNALGAQVTEVPIVGAMSASSCSLRIRTNASAAVKVGYAADSAFTNVTTTIAVTTQQTDDYTATVVLTNLNADTVYWYRVLVDNVVQSSSFVHKFKTFPSSGSFSFAIFADVAPNDRVAAAYQSAKNKGALFAMQIGDLDHRDPTSLSEMRTMHRDMKDSSNLHGSDFAQHILSKMSVVHVWDDHDYGGNDEDKDFSARSDGWKAFDEHWPTYSRPNASAGLWHSFTIGDAEFFVLDLRSQRDANVDTDNASKSMLDGDEITNDQKDWLKDGLSNSTATWKFIVSSVTANPTARPAATDAWRSFSTERDELKDYIDDNDITGVVILSGDLHTGGAIDDGTYSGFGLPELCVPHTNLLRGNTSNLGTWSEGVTSGAKGYGFVTVSSASVTLYVYGANGALRHSLTL